MIKYNVNEEFIAKGYSGNVLMKIASVIPKIENNTQSYLTEHFCPHAYDVNTSIFHLFSEEVIDKHFTERNFK